MAELQVYGGYTAVIIATCHHKLRSLLHGRNLARLLVAAALLLSVICLVPARRMQEDEHATT